jgi:hypothetical protein
MPQERKVKGYDEYELKDAVRTLRRAEEIKADKKLMAALKPFIAKEAKAMNKVASQINSRSDLRKKANELEAKGM